MANKHSLVHIPKISLQRSYPLLRQTNQLRKQAIATVRSIDMINWNGTPYGEHPDQVLDIQELNDLCPRDGWPTILFIHGGGWVEGDKKQFVDLMPVFARKRIMPVSMNYRLAPENRWPSQIEDVHLAIEFLKKQQIDLKRLVLWGDSAGGQLALLTALERDDIRAVVTTGAPCQLDALDKTEWQDCFLATDLEAASPSNRRDHIPPTYMVHGEKDTVVPVESARQFASQHAAVSLHIVEKGNHGLHWPLRSSRKAKKEAISWLVNEMDLPAVGSKWKRRKKKK